MSRGGFFLTGQTGREAQEDDRRGGPEGGVVLGGCFVAM